MRVTRTSPRSGTIPRLRALADGERRVLVEVLLDRAQVVVHRGARARGVAGGDRGEDPAMLGDAPGQPDVRARERAPRRGEGPLDRLGHAPERAVARRADDGTVERDVRLVVE